MERVRGKKGQIWQTLIPWLLGLLAFGLIILIYLKLSGKGSNALEFLKNLFKYGR